MLTAAHLQKSFPHEGAGAPLCIIGDISLDLKAGETVCLLGASGSGKTTLLHILAGLEAADAGTVSSGLARPGPDIGYMAQADGLIPWRSVLDNAGLGPELLGENRAAARSRAGDLLDVFGMGAFAGHFPHQISGGMRQRTLLARTLATSPRLLLLDEPIANLDILARRQVAAILRRYVLESGAAALVVTHSVEEACALADRILIMTRSPAVIAHEIAAEKISMDAVMSALVSVLGGAS